MIDFLKYKWLYFTISLLIIGIGLFSLFKWGYIFSIEFTGGAQIEIQTKKLNSKEIKKAFERQNLKISRLEQENNIIKVKLNSTNERQIEQILTQLKKEKKDLNIIKLEIIGPSFSTELRKKMIIASILALIIILLYISFAFKGLLFAIAAIIAAIHDSLILLGTYSLLSHFYGFEFDSLFITAVLTTLSFSVHDTIVVFDKIREYHSLRSKEGLEEAANKALTETMVRSLNNSFTIIFVLTALILFGGSTIRHFIIALLIGTIAGTYSSPFIATPIFVILRKLRK